jgi:TolB-like protein
MAKLRAIIGVLALSLSLFSCATTKFGEGGGDTAAEIRKLQRQLLIKPNDPPALRDLGVLYFQARQYELARLNLYRSFMQVEDDPRTIFYYGMTLEYLGDVDGALRVYINYSDVAASSQYQKLIEGRYRTLTREAVQKQFQKLLADEQKLGTEKISPKAVAVFPLAYQGSDPKYEALGKGLSEMMLIDLGQVKNLQVIERIRIEALLEELKFGQTDKVDPTTAPRFGKLLSAGRVVSGAFNVNNLNLRMDVAAWDVINKKYPDLKSSADELDNLFKVEKEVVFSIIKELGIILTPEERDRIQFIPTKNTFAFMNYCLGLKSEDARDFQGARVYYNQAASFDPNFGLAKTKVAAMEALSIAGGPKEKALSVAEQAEPGGKKTKKKAGMNLVIERLQHLGDGIGSPFRPGQDDRKPAQEVVEAGILPEPPKPPGR